MNKVIVNGQAAKPHREIKVGDEMEIHRPLGRKQQPVGFGVALAFFQHTDGAGSAGAAPR